MSDTPPVPPAEPTTPVPPVAAAPAPAGAPSKILPILAAVFAGLALILAFALPGVAWLPAIAGIVLAIIALVKKAPPRGLSIAAIIVAPLAWLIAIIMSIVFVAAGIGQSIDELDDPPTVSEPDDSGDQEEPASSAGIGDTVTNDDGVAITVSKIQCGLDKIGDQFFNAKAAGEFCEVAYTIDNGGDEEITLLSSDMTAYIGDAKYDASTDYSKFGDDLFTSSVNPGLSIDCVVYFDIPAGSALDSVSFAPLFSFGNPVTVDAG